MLLNKSPKSSTLLSARGISNDVVCGQNVIEQDCAKFKDEVAGAVSKKVSVLPIHPGFETHPYKGILENTDARKYIIGTFPPISYLIDSLREQNIPILTLKQPTHPYQTIDKPKIPFFHGNVSGLWKVLLSTSDQERLESLVNTNRIEAKMFLIQWLNTHDIYYDDIILHTQRKLGKLKPANNLGYTYEDVNLLHICPDKNLIHKVLFHPHLEVLCFTNALTFRTGGLNISRQGLVETKQSDALSIFLRACQNLGLHIDMQCQPHFTWTPLNKLTDAQKRTKLIFELRITKTKNCIDPQFLDFEEKIITVLTPFSPAAHGKIESNPIVMSFKNQLGHQLSAKKILPVIYEKFRNNTYADLYRFNINQ